MKKVLAIALLTVVTIAPAQAASNYGLPSWKPVDNKGLIIKLCDGKNLIYRTNGFSLNSKSIFVIPEGCK